MANVIQERSPFHELVNGKKFYPVDEYYVSEPMTDEEAEAFLAVPELYRAARADEVPEALAEVKAVPNTLKSPKQAAKAAPKQPAAPRIHRSTAQVDAAPAKTDETSGAGQEGEQGGEPGEKEEAEVF